MGNQVKWLLIVALFFVPSLARAACNQTVSASGPPPVNVLWGFNGTALGQVALNSDCTIGTGSSANPTNQKPAPYTNTNGDVFNQSVTTAYSLACPAGSTSAQIMPIAGGIAYRTDGTTVTAAVGVPWPSGTQLTFNVSPLSNVSIIAQSGSSTTIDVECFK